MGLSTPRAFMMEQNYPNPFNPSTSIRYHLATADRVTLKVYNTAGQEVATLVNGDVEAGTHQATWNAGNVASGVYFYQLAVGGKVVSTMKASIIK
jgi:flagellar hook assembly protein FlgD